MAAGTFICERHYRKLGRDCEKKCYPKWFENLCEFCDEPAIFWLKDKINVSEIS